MHDHLLLVDGTNILVRSIKAMERVPLSSEDGVVTGPLLVFINTLARYVRELQPSHMMVCFDGVGPSHLRTDIFPDYKKGRGHGSSEQHSTTITAAIQFLLVAGIPWDRRENIEADDLVSTYVSLVTNEAMWSGESKVTILSGDKDLLQLLDPRGQVRQIRPGAGKDIGNEVWDWERVESEMGVTPARLPLVMALTGDPIDGVPGIPGFGRKTAIKKLAAADWDLLWLVEADPKLEGRATEVDRNLSLVDLRKPHYLALPVPPLHLVSAGEPAARSMTSFFDRFQLESIRRRWVDGSLWGTRPNNTADLEELLGG